MGCNMFPTMGTMKKVDPPIFDLKVGHKCNESTQKLKDGGGPTWCTMQKRKHLKPNKKIK
jgi:hypothetical protein